MATVSDSLLCVRKNLP